MLTFYDEYMNRSDLDYYEKSIINEIVRCKVYRIPTGTRQMSDFTRISSRKMVQIIKGLIEKGILKSNREYAKGSTAIRVYRVQIPVSPQLQEHINCLDKPTPRAVIDYLNKVVDDTYVLADKVEFMIRERIEEGYTMKEFEYVIDKCYKAYWGTSDERFLSPLNLFNSDFISRLRAINNTELFHLENNKKTIKRSDNGEYVIE